MNKAAAVAIAAVVGIGGAAAGAFAWTGGAALQQLQAQSADLTKLSPSFKVVDEKVERGLFRSSYEVKLRIGCVPQVPGSALEAGEPIELGVHTDIHHGPLFGSGAGFAELATTLVVPDGWKARAEALTNKQPPLRVVTKIAFDRSFSSELTVPALKFEDPKAGRFETFPLKAKIKGSNADPSAGGTYDYELPSWGMNTQAPDASFEMTVGRMQGHATIAPRKDPTLWLSDSQATGSLKDLAFAASAPSSFGGPPTTFKSGFPLLTFKADSKLDKGLYASEVAYAGSGTFNAFKIDKVELKGGLRRLDAASYQALLKHVLENALSCDPKAGGLEAAFPALEKEAVTLLTHDPEYGLDSLAIEIDGQRGELSYALGTRGVKPSDTQRALLDLAMQYGVARAHVKVQLGLLDAIDKRLVASTPNAQPGMVRAMADLALAQLGESGYVVQTGDALESTLVYENGQLLLNGKPPVLPDLGNLMGGP
ncbi:MAG TPA: DUF945 family protein [Polyangiales bacterium]|nr:DUF945 family protein [Polyangiales bacterium]